jgi:hypothetical protein
VQAREIKGSIRLRFPSPQSVQIDSLVGADNGKVIIPVKKLKGGNPLFNHDLYNALNANKFPEISYTLNTLRPANSDTLSDRQNLLETIGELSVSGTRNQIKMPVVWTQESPTGFAIHGETSLQMTDYEISPPQKFFGTLKTGNTIHVQFQITIAPEN